MAFKRNTGDPFLPAEDTFGGRGKSRGLNHGGQYDVEYIVENLNRGKKPVQTAQKSAKRQAPKRGDKPFLRSSPPVAAPKPTAEEKAKMKNVVGVDDVSTDNENFVNVSGSVKKKIEEGLADHTCWRIWENGGKNCKDHARWALSQGRCNAPAVALARQRLDYCTRAQGNPDDVNRCTNGKVNYQDSVVSDKRGRRLHVQGTASTWLNELDAEVKQCLLKQQMSGGGGGNGGGSGSGNGGGNGGGSGGGNGCGGGTIYGCMDATAINFNPCANYPTDCEYVQESDNVDGNFDDSSGSVDAINARIDELFNMLRSPSDSGVASQTASPYQSPYGGVTDYQYDPYQYDSSSTSQAGMGGGVSPLLIGGIVLVAGMAIFLMNKPKTAVVATPAPKPVSVKA